MAIINVNSGNLRKLSLNYISLPPQIIQKINNPDALAIWAYLQSHNENWKPRRKQIMTHFGIGRDRYDKAIRALKEMELYWVENITNDNNVIQDREIWVSTLPKSMIHKLENVFQEAFNFDDVKKKDSESVLRPDSPQVGKTHVMGNPSSRENRPLNNISNVNKSTISIINEGERDFASEEQILITLDWTPDLKMVNRICERLHLDPYFFIENVIPSFTAKKNNQLIGDIEAELQSWAVRERKYLKVE